MYDTKRERSWTFLTKLITLSTIMASVVAGGYGLLVNQYTIVIAACCAAGPLLGGLVTYYFLSSVGSRSEEILVASLQQFPESPGYRDADTMAKMPVREGVNSRDTVSPIREQRLDPFLWSIVAILTSAAVTIAIGTLTPIRSEPLLLGLPFLALLAVAMIGFLHIDQHVRRRALLRTAQATLRETKGLMLRSTALTGKIDQRRKHQKG